MPKQPKAPVTQAQPTSPVVKSTPQPDFIPEPVQQPTTPTSREPIVQSVPEVEKTEDIYINTQQQVQGGDTYVNTQQLQGDDTYQNVQEIQTQQKQQYNQPAVQQHEEDEWATEAEPEPEKIDIKSPVKSPTSPKANVPNDNIYGNIEAIKANEAENGHKDAVAAPEHHQEEEIVLNPDDPGVTATALYDYQAAAEDEISFDPDDVITHIDMVRTRLELLISSSFVVHIYQRHCRV